MKQPKAMVKAAKKSNVHSVQRQPLSTETKEPMTGLSKRIRDLDPTQNQVYRELKGLTPGQGPRRELE